MTAPLVVYRLPGWTCTVIDQQNHVAHGVRIADLNQDGRLDIVAVGSASANLKWYENRPR